MSFKLSSHFKPTGDQPQAIKQITKNLKENKKYQVLLGVTGSGKTFTMANVIQNIQKPYINTKIWCSGGDLAGLTLSGWFRISI